MFGNLNPRELQKAMKRMGVQQQEIEATEVLIRTPGKAILIRNPHVLKVNMMGQESLQITGKMEEHEEQLEITEEDVRAVMQQSNCGEEEARRALQQSKGDIAEAILSLQP